MHGRLLVRSAVALMLAVAAPCEAAPHREYELRFGVEATLPLPESPSDAEIIAAVASLMSHKLALPFPDGSKAYVYVNEATLVEGLVQVGRLKSDDAWDKARFAAGVATPRGIFLRGDYLARMPLVGRAGLIAHELAHVSQSKLGEGGRRRAAVWIREGHADWVKYQVLDLLGFRPYAESRAEVARSVVRSTTPTKFFPDLNALAGSAAWTSSTNQLGAAATYGQSFLAIDWLIERYGSAKLREFLGRFTADASTGEHWGAAFPIVYRQFLDEFRARLENLR